MMTDQQPEARRLIVTSAADVVTRSKTPVEREPVRGLAPCDHRHRKYRTAAECRWDPEWVSGNAPWAVVAYCDVTTVQLYRTVADALAGCRVIDQDQCGHACTRRHQVVEVPL